MKDIDKKLENVFQLLENWNNESYRLIFVKIDMLYVFNGHFITRQT